MPKWFRTRPPARSNRWLLGGYAGLLGFFTLEGFLRQPGRAASLKPSKDDRGTTRLIIAAYAIASDLPLVARRLPSGHLPPAVAPAGLAVELSGLALRAVSMRKLGRFYTRTRTTDEDEQGLIETGPYRLVRHPGYLGSWLTWIGFALTSRSVPAVALVTGLLGVAYARRISAEEQLLRRDVSGYWEYAQQTRKLIPLIW